MHTHTHICTQTHTHTHVHTHTHTHPHTCMYPHSCVHPPTQPHTRKHTPTLTHTHTHTHTHTLTHSLTPPPFPVQKLAEEVQPEFIRSNPSEKSGLPYTAKITWHAPCNDNTPSLLPYVPSYNVSCYMFKSGSKRFRGYKAVICW